MTSAGELTPVLTRVLERQRQMLEATTFEERSLDGPGFLITTYPPTGSSRVAGFYESFKAAVHNAA